MDIASVSFAARWAHELGLTATSLFGGAPRSEPTGRHFAILDGRRASFACTETGEADVGQEVSRDWRWSADLPHHVLIHSDHVSVWSGRSDAHRQFERLSVEHSLEDFLAFLETARGAPLPDVVAFLLQEFRRVWGLMPGHGAQGHAALAAFLTGVQSADQLNEGVFQDPDWRVREAEGLGLSGDLLDLVRHLSPEVVSDVSSMGDRMPVGLRLNPTLAFRHVGGRLFQEAHGYLEHVQMNLFGGVDVTTVPTFSPSGAYFTPVPLARLLADLALEQFGRPSSSLSIADYACGSAVFLTEVLHALERLGYTGEVRLIGRDVSAEALVMAKVAIQTAARGINGIRVVADLKQQDSLSGEGWPAAQIVLMNPPFRSWEAMDDRARGWVRRVMEVPPRGRPDLSVGFVESAVRALDPGGVLATLVPVGVVASERLQSWREALLERTVLKAVAVLGEHDLFRHALVNVGLIVLRKRMSVGDAESESGQSLHVGWASAESGAASNMIRALRRRATGIELLHREMRPKPSEWSVTKASLETWRQRPTWLPAPSALGALHDDIRREAETTVENLFRVLQGIRTGAIDVFLVSARDYSTLPRRERQFFATAVDNASFLEGHIEPKRFLFIGDPTWEREGDVSQAVPTYFERFLRPSRTQLQTRRGLSRTDIWWQLTRGRGWTCDGRPRLVSKRFGLLPAFAMDLKGELAVVQGNAWAPTDRLRATLDDATLSDLLTAYWWLLNSRVFVALLREYCPNVAGGQLDLEHKYVKHVPLPDLRRVCRESPRAQELLDLMRLTNTTTSLPSLADRDAFAAAAYGTTLDAWPLAKG